MLSIKIIKRNVYNHGGVGLNSKIILPDYKLYDVYYHPLQFKIYMNK